MGAKSCFGVAIFLAWVDWSPGLRFVSAAGVLAGFRRPYVLRNVVVWFGRDCYWNGNWGFGLGIDRRRRGGGWL
jgi:hypothetical protein